MSLSNFILILKSQQSGLTITMSEIKDYLQANSDWVSNSDNTEFTNDNGGQPTFFVISTINGDFLNEVSRETGEDAPGTVRISLTELGQVPFYISREDSLDISDGVDSSLNGDNSDLEEPQFDGEESLSDNDTKDS